VDVYFACDEVELFLNGRSLGRKPGTADVAYIARFTVPYQPGELQAVAYRRRRQVGAAFLRTAGPAAAIRLTGDRDAIRANPNDLAYVTAEVVDADGTGVPVADHMVFFTVRGPGRMAAVANADPQNTEPYRGNAHSVWRGRCLAVVQPTGEPGRIMLRAQADGLDPAEVVIRAE
jgi:beta-galactosidase